MSDLWVWPFLLICVLTPTAFGLAYRATHQSADQHHVTFKEVRRRFNSDLPLVLADNEEIVHVATFHEAGVPGGSNGVDVVIATTQLGPT